MKKTQTILKIYNLSHQHLIEELKHYYNEGLFEELSLEFPSFLSESNVVFWDGIISGKLENYKDLIHEELEKGKILVHINTSYKNLNEYKSTHVATLEIGEKYLTKDEYSVILNQCYQKLHNV